MPHIFFPGSVHLKFTNRRGHFSRLRGVFDQLYLYSKILKTECFHKSPSEKVISLFLQF